MLDQPMSFWVLVFVAFVFIILMIIASISHLEDKTSWCTEHKGLMVKTIDGWKCIQAEALK